MFDNNLLKGNVFTQRSALVATARSVMLLLRFFSNLFYDVCMYGPCMATVCLLTPPKKWSPTHLVYNLYPHYPQ